jgi:hypothetical protein
VISPESVLPTMASDDDSTMLASWARANSACRRSAMSRTVDRRTCRPPNWARPKDTSVQISSPSFALRSHSNTAVFPARACFRSTAARRRESAPLPAEISARPRFRISSRLYPNISQKRRLASMKPPLTGSCTKIPSFTRSKIVRNRSSLALSLVSVSLASVMSSPIARKMGRPARMMEAPFQRTDRTAPE